MTPSRTRSLFTGPRVLGTLAVAGALVLGGGAYAYADGTPSPSSTSKPSAAPSGAPTPPKGGPAGMRGPAGMPGPGVAPTVEGTVTAVNGSTITVRSDSGSSYTVTLKSSGKVHQGPKSASLSSIKTGERVAVVGSKSGSTVTASSIDIRLAHIDGTVTKVDGSTVTIVDHDGFTRTVDISGVSNASVKAGQQVHAEGTVASNGTTLNASSIGTPPTPKAPRGN